MPTVKHKRALSLAAIGIAAAVALSACSAGTSSSSMPGMDHGSAPMTSIPASPSVTAGAFNDADVMFAQMMIPHHEQAVEMSDTVIAKPGIDQRVAQLAQQIKAAQAPEITTLKGWISSWAQPSTMPSGSAHGMDGMMSPDDFSELRSADATAAARLFLTQMIAHHEGAVAMAHTEKANGKHPEAVAMAGTIIDSQTKEIDAMKSLLGSL